MGVIPNKIFVNSRGIKNELAVAFGLIVMALLVFLGYLFPGASSWFEARSSIHLIVVLAFFVVTIGFIIIFKIIDPVLKISREAAMIADGDFNREIHLFREDEIGQLGEALNRMTRRMKENVEELKNFSQTTEMINLEINKRIVVLSNLLQVSNLIAQNAELKEVIEVGVGKCLSSGVMTFGALILKDRETNEYHVYYLSGSKTQELTDEGIKNHKIRMGEGLIGKAILRQSMAVVDKQTVLTPEIREFQKQFLITHAVIVPVSSKGNVFGALIAGNDDPNFASSNTDRELLQLISKQIAIATGNELLKLEIQKLEVIDRLTGLYNATYLTTRLNEEIKRAASFQRPCSFVLITIDQFVNYHSTFGHISGEQALIEIGAILKESIGAADKAARFDDHQFALILPEKNKRQSIDLAEAVRNKIEQAFSQQSETGKKLTCTSVVTENPIDGVTADALIQKAQKILEDAQKEGGNRVFYKV